MDFISVLLEIVKITVPALIVFFTVYTLLKQFTESQERMKQLDGRQEHQKTSLPLRLTAYERLSLYCERISIPAMIMRLKTQNMTAAALQVSLMLAVQQEYEHNITQQVYVSDQLWQILKIAKEDTLNVINLASDQVDPQADANELVQVLFKSIQEREFLATDTALRAIKKEASILL